MTPQELNNSILELINENQLAPEISNIMHSLAQRVELLTSIRGSAISELCLEVLRDIFEEDNIDILSLQSIALALWSAASNTSNEYTNIADWLRVLARNPNINIVSELDSDNNNDNQIVENLLRINPNNNVVSDSDSDNNSTIMHITNSQYNHLDTDMLHQSTAFFNMGEKKALNTMNAELNSRLNNIFSHPFILDSGSLEQLLVAVVPPEIASLSSEQFNDIIGAVYNWFAEITTTD